MLDPKLHLLDDELPLGVVAEVVRPEQLRIEERLQILDLEMTSLKGIK